ncbi:ribonuclease T2 family protein [Aidingimonas halophila]|uniref:Ribonuclease I n=1 Tax=Aidingimonas halophila TaxID=574349 RepID=A0A1H3FP66_9GAMM|nr:ribonuclease I [Aidingimonas halophila]GHC38237.1 ribonuclease I [Aidingimonas halophila]SDX92751.1 ribonuclease I [Aidingimonas halophila]
MHRGLPVILLLLCWGWGSAVQGDGTGSLDVEGVDHYTLALTWHPGFCATQGQSRDECRDPDESSAEGFVLHGLWPSLPARLAERGIDRRRWWQDGCFIEDSRPDGGFCAHPAPALPDALSNDLADAMPGRESCLDHYQYAKHAACLSLPEEAYFARAVELLARFNDSAFVDFVVINRGSDVAINDLIAVFESSFGEGTGQALHLACRGRGNRILSEIRIGIDAERLDAFPATESLVPLRPGECAPRVRIASM